VETKKMNLTPKLLSLETMVTIRNDYRRQGRQVVFTNGCFDLLHVGHVRYLAKARRLGDILIVGLNSDRSMRLIKGERRPLIPQQERAEVLAALDCVDHVLIFEETDPCALIQTLLPDILVKGADWALKDIIGADVVIAHGGRVERMPLVPSVSTSEIIDRILDRYR
jgi:D-beta-D-heptose 7-phosphate kinase/D-beta-D-heptose 1-phosphate adenosyltransferase